MQTADVDLETRIRAIVRSELAAVNRDPWHDRKSAAAYMSCCTEQITRLDRAGLITGQGEGRMRRWRQSELDRKMGSRAS